MNKKLKLMLSGLMLSMTVMAGCSNDNPENNKDSKGEKVNHTYTLGEAADDDGLEITFDKVQMLKSEDKKTDVVHLQFKLKNNSAEKKGFTAIELEVKNKDNKLLDVYPGENYGKEIPGGGTDTGSGYFTSKGSGPYTITYTDTTTNKVINWKLDLEK